MTRRKCNGACNQCGRLGPKLIVGNYQRIHLNVQMDTS